MSSLYPNNELMDTFKQQFDGAQLSYKAIHLNKGLVHTFFIKNSSEDSLKNTWRKISNFMAINFQNNLENEFERWNLYLFFLNEQRISNNLKYQIENDTFSSRKIVIDLEMDQDAIINDYILNNNLNISKENLKTKKNDFRPNALVWNLLKDRTLKKVKITSEAEKSFNQLVKAVKKKSHEV